tara:strand:+ start:76 stop:306 length:231 start_codon:yes stop_codon:yes gene_type:complete
LSLKKNKLNKRKRLKKEISIVSANESLFKSLSNKLSNWLTGKKPPDEIIDKDKLKESKILKLIKLKIKKISIVKDV